MAGSCIANGSVDLATQAVFDMIKSAGLTEERTVGVITKCDIAPSPQSVYQRILPDCRKWVRLIGLIGDRMRSESGIQPQKRLVHCA
jgi:hypothetical protein